MTQNPFHEVTLKSDKDYRLFASELANAMEKVSKLEYEKYIIQKEQKHLFIMLENMIWFQEATNKGVKVLGDFDSLKVEIFDYKRRQDEIANVYLNLNL